MHQELLQQEKKNLQELMEKLVGRDNELSQTSTKMLQLDQDISALKTKHVLRQSLQSEKWQEISKMASSMRKLTKSNVADSMGKY
ncbi:tryptophan 2,3-dioxygenase [Platysternon megacephalum]|uniref:Tryptophan 2,3-dioxygenase n=1 Tax=Platysternon megacephalum TaxID=55544 RepID=A0A4D9DIN2_9SAUR|nr:tryptophan 2,3-dioxygenase [Platysternon megacephalum]